MSLIDTQNIIIDGLEAIKDANEKRVFVTVDVWNDQPEEMIKKIVRLPAPLVALGGGLFGDRAVVDRSLFDCRINWDVFVLFENFRTTADATAQGLSFIDMVVAQISDTDIGNSSLVPAGFDLIATIGGKSAYVINFQLEERIGV